MTLVILTFYLVNYVAHCATVKPYPAEPVLGFSLAVAFALLLPASGITRAVDSIKRRTRLSKSNELQRAAQAGALCMVVRSEFWEPRIGDCIVGPKITAGDKVSVNKVILKYPPWHYEPLGTSLPTEPIFDRGCKVHGIYFLPLGYELTYVPSHAKVHDDPSKEGVCIEVASTYSLVKTAVAVLQTAYSAVTLIRTRGNQIQLFGYASFGLTVTPYLVMSLLNLVGQLLTPEYSHLYLVRSPEMNEAERRGGVFDGVIGSLVLPQTIQGPEEWAVEAAVTAESATDLDNETRDVRTQDFSTPEDVELCDTSYSGTCLSLRECTPGSSGARLLSLDPFKRLQGSLIGKPYGHEIVIPRCSPYERLGSASIAQDVQGRSHSDWPLSGPMSNVVFVIPLAIGLISLLVNGAFSHFQKGSSTRAQRAWTMSWLVTSMLFGWTGIVIAGFSSISERDPITKKRNHRTLCRNFVFVSLVFGIFFVPAVGGLVVVGQMLSQYGNCERI